MKISKSLLSQVPTTDSRPALRIYESFGEFIVQRLTCISTGGIYETLSTHDSLIDAQSAFEKAKV